MICCQSSETGNGICNWLPPKTVRILQMHPTGTATDRSEENRRRTFSHKFKKDQTSIRGRSSIRLIQSQIADVQSSRTSGNRGSHRSRLWLDQPCTISADLWKTWPWQAPPWETSQRPNQQTECLQSGLPTWVPLRSEILLLSCLNCSHRLPANCQTL